MVDLSEYYIYLVYSIASLQRSQPRHDTAEVPVPNLNYPIITPYLLIFNQLSHMVQDSYGYADRLWSAHAA